MIARVLVATALVFATGFTTGCGRVPGADELISEERAVPFHPARSAPKTKPVIVDGRVYHEGEAPAPFAMPEAAAHEAGKGHVRATISIKDVGTATAAISVAVLAGEESHYSKVWDRKELIGSTIATIAENLEPGDYVLILNRYNKAMGVYAQKKVNATVKAGETVDIRF